MNAVIDRVEGEFAVILLENGQKIDVLKEHLPNGASEGAHLIVEFGDKQDIKNIDLDQKATEDVQRRIQEKLDRLRRNEHLADD